MALFTDKKSSDCDIRDDSMTGSRLRGALGLPKKLKLSFKQMLAEMVREGLLKEHAKRNIFLGIVNQLHLQKTLFSPRPAAKSRKEDRPRFHYSIKKRRLKLVEKDRWIV
jgi:ribonuclease R